MPTQKIPKDGWVRELGDAESAVKRSRSAGAQLRLAIAAYKLRDFKKLKTAANLGLALDPSESEKELLKEYVEKSKEQKAIKIHRDSLQRLYEPGADCDIYYMFSDDCPFTNLNILQYAAVTGDVALIEEVVALGAALDFTVNDKENAPNRPPSPAPPGSTALLLACAFLGMYGEMKRRDPNFIRDAPAEVLEFIDQICECAIRLVYLGANCQVKLQIPTQRGNAPVNPKDHVTYFRALDLGGKTAQELAIMSHQQELIRAIEVMQQPENIHLTQCRCGSRLPWNQCHGAPAPGQSDSYTESDDGHLHWRYSPKASCPCNLANKEHYKCCWFTSNPCYKDDTSGELSKVNKDLHSTGRSRPIMPTQALPKNGWVQELGDAESAAKKSRSAGAQLRLAIAAYKLRDFKKVKIAADLGLALDPSESEKELLKDYVEKSKDPKAISVDCHILELQKYMREPGANCDLLYFSSNECPFTNLNILQYAASNGDVPLMEEVIALGAALDSPVSDEHQYPDVPPISAPPGSTALLLACAFLGMYGEMERRTPIFRRTVPAEVLDTIDQNCQCAIRLVYLGANCQVKLQLPTQRGNAAIGLDDPVTLFRFLNLGGKTAQELAIMSHQRELIRAIELMQKPENRHLTQCRCGSRLPWNQCHGAPAPGQSDSYTESDDGRLRWRYSPKATCPCKLTDKEHYKCCWFTSTPSYKDDIDGDLTKIDKVDTFDNTATQTLLRLQQMRISQMMHSNMVIPQGTTMEEFRTTQTDLIRSLGLTIFSDFNGRRCGVKDWDPLVYAGVVDRIDDFFVWNDLHWRLDKVELLHRTKEWNEALEQYCDDMALTGAEREAIVQRHTANPCAPCSNPSCSNWETKAKEFKSCSICKAVAYCSRDCQKKDWKAQHKSTCVAT
jgi:hypothetical protein